MRNLLLGFIAALLLIGVVIGVILLTGGRSEQRESSGPPAAQQPTTQAPPQQPELSEQPDMAVYREYFDDIHLATLAEGSTEITGPQSLIPTTTFRLGMQFCTDATVHKAIPEGAYATAVYDTVVKINARPKVVFPYSLNLGGSAGCEDLPVGVGTYEYKIYVNDALAAVLPLEVR